MAFVTGFFENIAITEIMIIEVESQSGDNYTVSWMHWDGRKLAPSSRGFGYSGRRVSTGC